MAELDIDKREPFPATASLVWPIEVGRWTPVKEGPTTWWLTRTWNGLPYGTALSGRLLFGERVYGRFTHARAPDGRTWPVCIELWEGAGPRGAPPQKGSTANTVKIYTLTQVEPVKSFGK
jgi:serine/threonine-protein kinase